MDVQVETVIHRPRDVVADYAGDPSNAPDWYANIASVEWRTQPPVQLGSRMDFVARFLGRRIAYTYEVVELVGRERLVMRATGGPMPWRRAAAVGAADEHGRTAGNHQGPRAAQGDRRV